jgi:hypothetical protein
MRALLLLFAINFIALACKNDFAMTSADFNYPNATVGSTDTMISISSTNICLWPKGYYLTKICSYQTDVDGRPITSYRSCPDCDPAMEPDSLDKTAFFAFLDEKRVVYYSKDAAWSSRRQIQKANNPAAVYRDLASDNNKSKSLMRGYYVIKKMSDQKIMISMHLERANKKQVFIDLEYDEVQAVMYIKRVGRKDDLGFKDNKIPPMIEWNSVYADKLEFHCELQNKPNLMANGMPLEKPEDLQFLPW